MAYIQPQSEVWLCRDVPLDPSYDNQLTFTTGTGANRQWDLTAQRAYFASKAVFHPQNFSIVKERDGVLRMTGDVGNYYDINYMYFTNTNFSNKFFYAFVTQVEYVNPNTTLIYFELDEFQTWANDIVWMESSIEREHTEHDELYANLEDEGIGVNDLQPYAEEYLDDALGQKILVVGATESYTQMLATIQNEGLTLYYNPYDRDYPVYQNDGLSKNKTIIQNLKCFYNNVEIAYNNFSYDTNSNQITIKGLSEVNIDKITFTLFVNIAEKVHFWSPSIQGGYMCWYVKGIRVGSDWIYSLDGIRVSYNIFDNYPELSRLTGSFSAIANLGIRDGNNNWISGKKEGYMYFAQAVGLYSESQGWLMFSDVTPENGYKITFALKCTDGLVTHYYSVTGTYDGTSWTFTGEQVS